MKSISLDMAQQMGLPIGDTVWTDLTPADFRHVMALHQSALQQMASDDWGKSLTTVTQAIAYASKKVKKTDPIFVDLYSVRSSVLLELNGLEAAEYDIRSEQAILDALPKKDVPRTADAWLSRCRLSNKRGQYQEAIRYCGMAIDLANTTEDRAAALVRLIAANDIAEIELYHGDIRRVGAAISKARQYLRVTKLNPQQISLRWEVDNIEATYQMFTGQYARSREISKALSSEILKSEMKLDLRDVVLLRQNAILALMMNQYDIAEEIYAVLLDWVSGYEDGRKPLNSHASGFTVTILSFAAQNAVAKGDLSVAQQRAMRAAQLIKRQPGIVSPLDASVVLSVLGDIAVKNLDWNDADRHYSAAAKLYKGCGNTEGKLGIVALRLGQSAQARAHFEAALSTAFTAGCNRERWEVLALAANYFAELGNADAAILLGKLSVADIQIQRRPMEKLDAAAQEKFVVAHSEPFYKLAGRLVEQGRMAEANDVLTLLKRKELNDFSRGPRPETVELLLTHEEELQRQYLKNTDQSRINQLDEFSGAHKNKLSEYQPVFASLQLRPNEAHIIYWQDNDAIYISLTTANGISKQHKIAVKKGDFYIALSRFLASVDSRKDLSDSKDSPLLLSKELYRYLWAPLANDLAQVSGSEATVYLSAHGLLRRIPFAALFDGNQFLVERYTFTSITDAVADSQIKSTRKEGLAGFAAPDPAFGLPGLKYSADEVKAVVKMFRDSAEDSRAFIGKDFNRGDLATALTGTHYRKVHIASHFMLGRTDALSSYLVLGDQTKMSVDEFSQMDLKGLNLLVLSACETAVPLNDAVEGPELESFSSLARKRGAGAIIATLWPVDDAGAAKLVTDFYGELNKRSLPRIATALRNAQLTMMKTQRHPYYWAPYLAMGGVGVDDTSL